MCYLHRSPWYTGSQHDVTVAMVRGLDGRVDYFETSWNTSQKSSLLNLTNTLFSGGDGQIGEYGLPPYRVDYFLP